MSWLIDKLGGNISFYFIVSILLVIGMIIVPNLSQIYERLGFQTKTSLRIDNTRKADQIDRLIDTNISNEIEHQRQAEIKDMEEKILLETMNQSHSIEKLQHDENEKRISAISKIKSHYAKLNRVSTTRHKSHTTHKHTRSRQSMNKTVAAIQIAYVWKMYCSMNTNTICHDNS